MSFVSDNQSLMCFTSAGIKANMYVLIKNHQALIIDPHNNVDLLNFLDKNKVKEITVVLTHEHPDHTNGIPVLSTKYKLKLICQQKCAEAIANSKNNRPTLIAFVLAVQDEKNGTNTEQRFLESFKDYTCQTDITFDKNFNYDWQGEHLSFHHIPGHSQGSCCILLNNKVLFTGDSLLAEYPVITRFPGGSSKDYKNISLPFLKSLNPNLVVYPGHGKSERLGNILKDAI